MSNGRTVILGIGGGGGKVIRCMAANKGAAWLEFAYIDTDAVDLANIPGVTCLSAGSDWAKGRSCGGDPLLGEKAVGASIRELKALVADTEMVIVVGCLGRGVASGGVQIVSRLVREEELLAFFFVTMPFAHEGNGRHEIAESALRDSWLAPPTPRKCGTGPHGSASPGESCLPTQSPSTEKSTGSASSHSTSTSWLAVRCSSRNSP